MNLMPSKISEPKRSEGGMENAHTADAKPKKGTQNGKSGRGRGRRSTVLFTFDGA
jgi:hypothetical protein